jgi:hypothetical protein
MRFAKLISAVRQVVRTVAEAPRVHREVGRHRAGRVQGARVPAPLAAEDVTGTVPEVVDIEQAARDFERARVRTNEAARLKRAAEKTLKRTPDGVYGAATVERFESSRQVADLEEIRAVFAAHGLGDVPMKRCAPSITITIAETVAPLFSVAA